MNIKTHFNIYSFTLRRMQTLILQISFKSVERNINKKEYHSSGKNYLFQTNYYIIKEASILLISKYRQIKII